MSPVLCELFDLGNWWLVRRGRAIITLCLTRTAISFIDKGARNEADVWITCPAGTGNASRSDTSGNLTGPSINSQTNNHLWLGLQRRNRRELAESMQMNPRQATSMQMGRRSRWPAQITARLMSQSKRWKIIVAANSDS